MADTSVPRDIASRLNPIISIVGSNDTISQCAQLVQALGLFLSTTESDDSRSSAHLLTEAIAAALNFEVEASA